MDEGITISDHLSVLNEIVSEFESIGVKINDENKTLRLIWSLPSSYKHMLLLQRGSRKLKRLFASKAHKTIIDIVRNQKKYKSEQSSELHRASVKSFIVAPSGQNQQHNTLTRRKSAPPSTLNQAAASGSKRIVLKESSSESELDLPFWQRTWFILLLLLMAISFFGLALFLFLTLDSDYVSTPVSAASEGVQITYGSTIKLMHEKTKFRLHSHDVPYGSGSGQQSVTGFPGVDDANSYWVVRSTDSSKQGDPIKSGSIIRLQHMKTRRWLHSHLHASPISGNMEVSCFGDDNESDTGDYWRLEIEGSGKTWRQDQRIRFQHVDTGGYLHSHDKKYTRIAGGQQEVCGVREKRADNVWLAAEGVYFPVTESK
ncbi:Stromal cell-derived factor 2-like protein [Capsicum annuum]|nr:Stromal cell-derived factor 2-like protein [Capsicum annuum]